MHCSKLACKGGSRRLPLLSLAALAASALVAAAASDFRGALKEGADPLAGSNVTVERSDEKPLHNVDGAPPAGDATVKFPQDMVSEPAEDGQEEVSLEGSEDASEKETIPIVLDDGSTVGEIQKPDLDRQRRKLRGMKTLMISMMAFLFFLATSPSGGASGGEKVALTFALVGLAQFLQSLFSKHPEYQFSLDLKTDEETGKQRAVLEYGGLSDTKRFAAPRLRKALTSLLFAIPTFFLLSGLIITVGYTITATFAIAAIVSVVAVLGALGSGAGGALLDLFKAF